MAEAMLDMMRNPLPLPQWACIKGELPPSNFEALPGAIVLERLQKDQIPYLTRLFEEWHGNGTQRDFEPHRLEAHRQCPGLTALWSQPFMASYLVADGQLVIRFRTGDHGTEVATDMIPKH